MPRPKSWSMYPNLDGKVQDLLVEDNLSFAFRNMDDDRHKIREYDTNVMGRFTCHNHRCPSNGWSSKKIAVTIRLYHDNQYNVRVYHQHCQKCNWLARPMLDDSYAERVVYRLKYWSGVEQEVPPFSGESKGPHQRSLCEGCKNGHCSQK